VACAAPARRSNFENETGSVHCNTCNAKYETHINALSDPIDVYSEWIDACERANPEE
jgi:transcription elongation factor Elf1